jgi:hypothetical protein
MTKKQGNALPAGIYKVFWKRGGWSWGAISAVHDHIPEPETKLREWLEKRCPTNFDRDMLCYNWSCAMPASKMWRKIAKVERAPLVRMKGER